MPEIHRWPVISPHKGPETRKMFQFGDVTMGYMGIDTIAPEDVGLTPARLTLVNTSYINRNIFGHPIQYSDYIASHAIIIL